MVQLVSVLTVQSRGPEFKSYNGPAWLHEGLDPSTVENRDRVAKACRPST